LLVLVALVLVTASIAIFLHLGERTSPLELRPQQITTNSAERPVYSAGISPDGKYGAYEEQGEIVVSLIASQESRILKKPSTFSGQDRWWPVGWFPDGTHLLASSQSPRATGTDTGIWNISAFTGSSSRLTEEASGSGVSPDGFLIAMLTGGN
jgi:hypothetical protein